MNVVTLWFRMVRDEVDGEVRPEMNHLSDGFECGPHPLPKDPSFKAQKQWANETWHHEHAHLSITTGGRAVVMFPEVRIPCP